jgi:hypothetical protein
MSRNRNKTEAPDNGSATATQVANETEYHGTPQVGGTPLTGYAPVSDGKPIETKEAKFVRLAKFRLPKLLKAARQVSNLGNTASYSYTPEQKQKLLAYASECLREIIDAFSQTTKAPTEIDI